MRRPTTQSGVGAAAVLGVGVAWALAGLLLSGGAAALSALVGTLVVLVFFVSGIVPILVAGLDATRPDGGMGKGVGLGLLLLTYTTRLAVALVVLRLSLEVEGTQTRWLGLAVILGAFAWTTAAFVVGLRRPGELEVSPVIGPDPQDDPAPRR